MQGHSLKTVLLTLFMLCHGSYLHYLVAKPPPHLWHLLEHILSVIHYPTLKYWRNNAVKLCYWLLIRTSSILSKSGRVPWEKFLLESPSEKVVFWATSWILFYEYRKLNHRWFKLVGKLKTVSRTQLSQLVESTSCVFSHSLDHLLVCLVVSFPKKVGTWIEFHRPMSIGFSFLSDYRKARRNLGVQRSSLRWAMEGTKEVLVSVSCTAPLSQGWFCIRLT